MDPKFVNSSMENLTLYHGHNEFTNDEFPPIVSDSVRRMTEIVIDLGFSFAVSLMGICTNVIVIAVFASQGFRDSVGISMTFIAFWDLIKCLGGAAQRISGPLSLWDPASAESWSNISIVVFNYLLSFSSYVTSVLAAYVAVERCLCVCIPLKVKKLLTRRVSCFVGTLTSVVVFAWFSVLFGIYDIYWSYNETYNTSIACYRYNSFSTNNTHLFEYYNISGIVWPLASLVVISASTIIISYKLRQASNFRYRHYKSRNGNVSSNGNTNNIRWNSKISDSNTSVQCRHISRRDGQVIKMLLVIVAVYIVSLFPRVTIYMVKYFVYEFYFLRKYHNIFMTTAYIVYFFDLLNGAINLFIFLRMSSGFRQTCRDIMACDKKSGKTVNDERMSSRETYNYRHRASDSIQ